MVQQNFECDEHDVFIVTYPKCGTTWVQKICVELMKCVDHKYKADITTNNEEKVQQQTDETQNSETELSLQTLYLSGRWSRILWLEKWMSQTSDSISAIQFFWNQTQQQQQLSCQKESSQCDSTLVRKRYPFFRFWKTHSCTSMFPVYKWHKHAKIIVMLRNPKDVVVSYYEHLKTVGSPVFTVSFQQFLYAFALGLVPGVFLWLYFFFF
ncbi:hypothetical protein RFI_04432 [Reticulomyxa filosa]|uniref:Sulfotransferase domain-containing protein n=1 Tax=Reticulomyxa filosa TaxID=46433 RepID=X6P391_RETFI|nr:hypothetical protein RFI_04432 [Reticulomyxa filosa]|eukprot:ETO32686.1 hypothetical protein RFI_04432 [Reticulomyxa filosa]